MLLFAVFDSTEREGCRLAPAAFRSKQLVRGEVSVARRIYLAKEDFERHVAEPLKASAGPLVGVACADVRSLRALKYLVQGTHPPLGGRAVCVLDKVSALDHDSHAALKYSESQVALTEKQKMQIRPLIQADLADTFGDIEPLEVVFSPPIS